MNILCISAGDNGGGSYWMAKAINDHTEHHARAVRMIDTYIKYPHDLLKPSRKELLDLLSWADVVHIRDGSPFKDTELSNKAVVVTYTGVSYRRRAQAIVGYARARGWLPTVSTIDLTCYVPDNPPVWLPNPRDDMAGLWAAGAESRRQQHEFYIAQAPTYRDRKGTDLLIEAVEGMDGVALDLIEQVTYDECLRRKAGCHILVDQFTFGYGNNAIEAWAMGQPVIGGVCDPKYRKVVLGLCGYLPYLDTAADVKALRANILKLKEDAELYKNVAERGRKYFFEFHYAPIVAEKAVGIYEQAMEKKAPRSWPAIKIDRPLKVLQVGEWDYAGCGYFLAQALKSVGHESRAIRWAISALQFPTDVVAPTNKELLALWQWADVIHIHDGIRKFGVTLPPKPTMITHHGSHYRRAIKAAHDLAKANGWLATVATPDLTLHGLPWLPDCRPDLSRYVAKDGFIMCHAPTRRGVKGTEAVIAGASGFTLDVIENVTWEECLKRKGRAAVTVDQFQLGYGCNAIEGWLMGQPVVAGGPMPIMQAIEKHIGFVPFVECTENPEAIREVLTRLHDDGRFYRQAVELGQRCINKFHTYQAAAKIAIGFYHQLLDVVRPSLVVPLAGDVPIVYIGLNDGLTNWRGPVSNRKYKFGRGHPFGLVDARDLTTGDSKKPGFLEMVDKRGRRVFRKG